MMYKKNRGVAWFWKDSVQQYRAKPEQGNGKWWMGEQGEGRGLVGISGSGEPEKGKSFEM